MGCGFSPRHFSPDAEIVTGVFPVAKLFLSEAQLGHGLESSNSDVDAIIYDD
jgi:hypothetical protein